MAIGVVMAIALMFTSQVAKGTAPAPYKVICHHTPGNDVTLSFQNQQSYEGHLGTPHNDQTYDTDGACPEPTPEVSAQPTVEPTPEENGKGDGPTGPEDTNPDRINGPNASDGGGIGGGSGQ